MLTGRLYAGYNVLMKADDFKVPLDDKSGDGFSRFLSAGAGSVKVLTAQAPELGGLDLVRSMEIEHALVAPILMFGKPIGLYFIGRGMDRPYSSEEKLWVEAIAGHVGLAFEQVDQSGLHR
jgi:GAF domain-containing protein